MRSAWRRLTSNGARRSRADRRSRVIERRWLRWKRQRPGTSRWTTGAYMPFFYGRWDNAAQAHVDAGVSERSRPVRDGFRAEGAFVLRLIDRRYPAMSAAGGARRVPVPPRRGLSRDGASAVSYTHLRAHETRHDLVCRLLLE